MIDFLQNEIVYYIICGVLTLVVLLGISLMSKVKTAVLGNRLSAVAMLLAIVLTLIHYGIISDITVLIICLVTIALGSLIGIYLAVKVKMIQMPEMVALFNGFGGAASAIVGACTMFTYSSKFELATAILALIIGALTFTGSLIAAGKLAKIINGRPVKWKAHELITTSTLVLLLIATVVTIVFDFNSQVMLILMLITLALSSFFGVAFAIRVGGADMPITISLLNSFSGVAGSIAGMAINDILLVAVGGIVGASGLLLTQIMCRAMNRSLLDILLGKTSVASTNKKKIEKDNNDRIDTNIKENVDPVEILRNAKNVIIVPGYGMALAQAQHLVKQLAHKLEQNGAQVKFAIHPVAGRMPGHMNVLLAEADVE
ncbi:MAG TPA: NAD(P)(+) transhydrogenase (Re/Si-specific) subunit beta, partial [Haloplasmataceae bacterium]